MIFKRVSICLSFAASKSLTNSTLKPIVWLAIIVAWSPLTILAPVIFFSSIFAVFSRIQNLGFGAKYWFASALVLRHGKALKTDAISALPLQVLR